MPYFIHYKFRLRLLLAAQGPQLLNHLKTTQPQLPLWLWYIRITERQPILQLASKVFGRTFAGFEQVLGLTRVPKTPKVSEPELAIAMNSFMDVHR